MPVSAINSRFSSSLFCVGSKAVGACLMVRRKRSGVSVECFWLPGVRVVQRGVAEMILIELFQRALQLACAVFDDLLLINSVLYECFDLARFCLFAGYLYWILSCHGGNCVVAHRVLEEVFA